MNERLNVISMFETIASNGHAPVEGCNLFGVGFEEAFSRLQRVYLEKGFSRESSSEKFVIGPYGSGKTHFLRQFMDIARDVGCVTVEVTLDKAIDFTKSLLVYKEVTREIRPPGTAARGLKPFLLAICERVRLQAPTGADPDAFLAAWIAGLDQADFKLEPFGRVARKALEALVHDESTMLELGIRYLGGDISDREVTKAVGTSPVRTDEHNLHAKRATLSLYQLARRAGFRGTVVAFDEAEQGLGVDKKKTDKIRSMLQSGINSIADLDRGSALILYAFTPDLERNLEEGFGALQQRVADPGLGAGFFDGNTRAVKIDLTRSRPDLHQVGRSLVRLLYETEGDTIEIEEATTQALIDQIADRVTDLDASAHRCRTFVKKVCTILIRLNDDGILDASDRDPAPVSEV
jgi:hypothetical protein